MTRNASEHVGLISDIFRINLHSLGDAIRWQNSCSFLVCNSTGLFTQQMKMWSILSTLIARYWLLIPCANKAKLISINNSCSLISHGGLFEYSFHGSFIRFGAALTKLDFNFYFSLPQPRNSRSRHSMTSKVWFSKARSARWSCWYARMPGLSTQRFDRSYGPNSALNITMERACSKASTGTWLIRFVGVILSLFTFRYYRNCQSTGVRHNRTPRETDNVAAVRRLHPLSAISSNEEGPSGGGSSCQRAGLCLPRHYLQPFSLPHHSNSPAFYVRWVERKIDA